MSDEFVYNLCAMEGIIGGSDLDELQDAMGFYDKDIDVTDDCILFKVIEDSSIDLTKQNRNITKWYGIKSGQTFVARCFEFETSDYKYVEAPDNKDYVYYTWIKVES